MGRMRGRREDERTRGNRNRNSSRPSFALVVSLAEPFCLACVCNLCLFCINNLLELGAGSWELEAGSWTPAPFELQSYLAYSGISPYNVITHALC